MFIVDGVVVQEAVLSSCFSCDVQQCKGACCTFEGGSGAPLQSEEIAAIEEALPKVIQRLSPRAKQVIEQEGAIQWFGSTPVLNCVENKECIFVTYTADGIARCVLEQAYTDGIITFRKPLSCHLFPIRITHAPFPVLSIEKFSECEAGWRKGEEEKIPLLSFLRDALVRCFGSEWYEKLQKFRSTNMRQHCTANDQRKTETNT